MKQGRSAEGDDLEREVVKKQKVELKPGYTIYIKNLNDKLKKEFLKRQLYLLFSTYGEVIDVMVMKTPKMRGQAHVAFTSMMDARVAMQLMSGELIFDKPLVIEWAREESKLVQALQ